MALFSWPVIGLGVVLLLIPVVTGIILARRNRSHVQGPPPSETWQMQRFKKTRSGKPVNSCFLYSGETRQGIPWEMEAVSQEDPRKKMTAAYRNVSLIRSGFYTLWEAETSNLSSEYILIFPRNVLNFYQEDQPDRPGIDPNIALEQRLERIFITDLRRMFALTIKNAEELFSSMRRIYPEDAGFQRICATFGTSVTQAERLLTPQFRTAITHWKETDLSIGISPNRTVILVSGDDLSDEIKRLEMLVHLGATLLEVQEKITSPVE